MRRVWIGTVILVTLVLLRLSHAAAFSCAAGDVTCLRAAINAAKTNGEAQTLTLEAGTYTITAVDNLTDGANGLPSIHGTFTIRSTAPPIAVAREVSPSQRAQPGRIGRAHSGRDTSGQLKPAAVSRQKRKRDVASRPSATRMP